jgi:hypothetical protein
MAKRNELCSLLGGLNSGNARGRENIAFGDLIPCDQVERFPLEPNLTACNGSSFTKRLRRNINHLRATIGIDVSESFHLSHAVILSEAKNHG